jgi:hypothetical protein
MCIDTLFRELIIPAADNLTLKGNVSHVIVQDVRRNIYKNAQLSEVKDMPLSVAKRAVIHCVSNNPRHQYVIPGAEAHYQPQITSKTWTLSEQQTANYGPFSDHMATMIAREGA